MHMQNPAQMSLDEILHEITERRGEIERLGQRLAELAKCLYIKTRQDRMNDSRNPIGTVYTLYANAWIRFSGMVEQGLRKTTVSDRVLKAARVQEQERKEQVLSDRQKAERQAARKKKAAEVVYHSSDEVDLAAYYGV